MLILGSDGKLSDKLNVLRIKKIFIIYFSMCIHFYISINQYIYICIYNIIICVCIYKL